MGATNDASRERIGADLIESLWPHSFPSAKFSFSLLLSCNLLLQLNFTFHHLTSPQAVSGCVDLLFQDRFSKFRSLHANNEYLLTDRRSLTRLTKMEMDSFR